MRQYLIHFIAAALVFAMLGAGFNWLVDPYLIFDGPRITGFNTTKTRLDANEGLFKTLNLAHQKPDIAFLGTSRTNYGINPIHPAFHGKKSLNIASGGQPYFLSKMLFDLLVTEQTPQVIFGIDFFVSNDLLTASQLQLPPDQESIKNFSRYRKMELLFSFTTLMDSLKTFLHLGSNPLNGITNGGLKSYDMANLKKEGNRRLFLSNERIFLDHYLPAPRREFSFNDGKHEGYPMAHVKGLINRAYSGNIDLRLFISPSHARQWETIAVAGLWEQWEEWKQMIVKINEEEAAKFGKSPFPVWDFSGYNSITTEIVPDIGDSTLMKYYFESSHAVPAIGMLVLDRMFDFRSPERELPEDFGVRISQINIKSHLEQIRSDRIRYRQTHPEDVAEIEAICRKWSEGRNMVGTSRRCGRN